MDLFNREPENDQDALREAMRAQWESDLATVKNRRVIPDWIGEPNPLSKDKAALLEYLYDNGYIVWTDKPGKERIEVARILGYEERDDGSIAAANAKYVVNSCLRDGLVETRIYRGKQIIQMTTEGEYALSDWQIERELGFI